MNFLIRLRLCYPTFGCCRTHQYPSFARSAQTCGARSSPAPDTKQFICEVYFVNYISNNPYSPYNAYCPYQFYIFNF